MIIDASERFEQAKRGTKNGADKAIQQVGAQALDALFDDMHSKIDPISRQIFAANFGKLLKKYNLFRPRYFEIMCGDVASSYESFRTTFGSMKNPDSKNIPSGKIYWKNYCQLLIKRLKQDRIDLSEEYVAHKLTYGTPYHPTAKSPSKTDQVVRSYQTLAMNFDTEFGLLETYREISNHIAIQVAEKVSRKVVPDDEYTFFVNNVDIIHCSLSDYFNEEYLTQRQFSATRFIDLAREELTEVIGILTSIIDSYEGLEKTPDNKNEESYFIYARQELVHYNDATDIQLCHVPEPHFDKDFRHHAHCLLGVNLYELGSKVEAYTKEFLERNSSGQRWINPVFEKIDYSDIPIALGMGYTYLVLFPDETLSKILPFIVVEEEEGTHMALLDEDVIAYRGNRFINTTFPHGEGSENNNLIDLLSDAKRTISQLKETAPNLRNHPILVEKQKSKDNFQSMVDALCNPFEEG